MVNWLRAIGHDVALASEFGMGQPDSHWLTLAEAEQRLILTSDKDFGELVFRDRLTTFGIILLRLDDMVVSDWVTRLQEAWSVVKANPSGCFIVTTSGRVRVRSLGKPQRENGR
jgi:predicted nuclease of predicted toxin-antitoxin system